MKIINAVMDSRFYTTNPLEACLFVLSLDTLDRDPLSQDFVRNMQARVDNLKHWNNGLNHIVFNLYSGTWPDYTETLGFDIGQAVLAKASISNENYRPGFDISLPLFHKHHPEKGGGPGFVKSNNFPVVNKYFVAFKGKRYVHGIGSDTRNSLHHLHNGEEVVMVTTCKHGKNWREMMDERCEEDNLEYDRWDYENLLANSTFCLVPRGRRLGSFRFLETLQAGCLPVILSNGWQLPFDEVLDWEAASIAVDERQLLQVPEILHGLSRPRIFAMRQQTQVLWDRYLSSVQKIVDTTLEIMFERVHPTLAKDSRMWNTSPGALWTDISHRYTKPHVYVPMGYSVLDISPITCSFNFTAIISTSSAIVSSNSQIFKLIRNIASSSNVSGIVVLWSSSVNPPPSKDWALLGGISHNTPISVVQTIKFNISTRFLQASLAPTDAVLSLDDDVNLTTDEINFAFEVWRSFEDRIVGFPARTHYWDDTKRAWAYTSKWSNEYSIVLTNAAFLHKKYAKLYLENLPRSLASTIESYKGCEHILMNFLVSHVTKQPPIKVTQRKKYKDTATQRDGIAEAAEFSQKQTCVNVFSSGFGYMPLVKSQLRMDPVLFKDPVSNLRKKFRKMELVQ
jgi:glucuronyl/N-acetylglucosaminyl transferase EXT1